MNKLSYKTFLILFVLLFTKNQAIAQKKILKSKFVQSFISKDKDSTKTASVIALPVLAYSPETGLEYGVLGNYVFTSDKLDSLTRSSDIGIISSLTSKKQSNVKLALNYWSPKNKYHYIALINYKNFPFSFYGIGDETLAANKSLLSQKLLRLNFEGERLILKNYYGGLNAQFESYVYKSTSENEGLHLGDFYGGKGGKYIALGVSQVYDARNSNTYTTKGLYGRIKYAYAPNLWGQDNFNGSLISLDLRTFFPLNKKLTLGLNSIYKSTLGKNVPFYLMPQLGNDEMMRGYYQGRYRDKNLLTFQSELRYRIHPRIGLAAFGATGTVYHKGMDLSKLKFSFGSGIHYFFNIEHNVNIRLDYAIGEKTQGEQRQSGFYISLGQAF
ncbi:MAG TPA: BamA/TamA family outer membrane protein [Sphingobacteriaceae bacterium]|nr:BamA/TamA family outer membrane protein [Sphingobacteriaceae bacterium]